MRMLARTCAVLMLAVVAASAWLRLAQARPPCPDWPSCRQAVVPLAQSAPAAMGAPAVLAVVRGTHRVAASAVLLLTLALAALSLARTPRQHRVGAVALGMLGLALGLAVLGIVTPGSRSAAVLLGNLLGGQLLLALAWALWRELDAPSPVAAPLSRWAAGGAGLWWLQAALGAVSGAGFGAVSPFVHLATAMVALPWAFGLGWAVRRHGSRTEGAALMAIASVQLVLGMLAAGSAAAPALVLPHGVAAALGLALLSALAIARVR